VISASHLCFCDPFLNVVFCVCLLLFFSQPDVVNITLWWITGHIYRSIVDKIDPTSEDVERVKNTLSIRLGYIFLWNVIRRIYFQCLQLISKTISGEPWWRFVFRRINISSYFYLCTKMTLQLLLPLLQYR
jgi:hypothetical protein